MFINRHKTFFIFVLTTVLAVSLAGCVSSGDKQTLASLENVEFDLKEAEISGSLDKAMESYQKFLEETPETAMTPEALRRLADLKIEKEYGVLSGGVDVAAKATDIAGQSAALSTTADSTAASLAASTAAAAGTATALISDDKEEIKTAEVQSKAESIANVSESEKEFEKRATKETDIKKDAKKAIVTADAAVADDLASAGAKEAIELYKGLLVKYPHYERNDQVLYQLSRAYEEVGEVDKAMLVLNRLVKEYPNSRHIDEAQFRRAEFFFTRKKYLDSEEAYQAVIDFGISSAFYDLALYKQGWAYFKQDLYEEALHDFIGLLDYKISIGYDFEQITNKIERKRIEDTYRVISLSFSYLGGPQEVVKYFETHGSRQYEASIYSHLGEYYLTKRRYADAAGAYNSYVERNPLNKVSPHFHIRVIDIYLKGGFPKLVIDSKKNYASTYGLRANYWTFFDINSYPDVIVFLKSNLTDLANHYHAQYQNRRLRKFRKENFAESARWYREFLDSFPEDQQSPGINFQLAELLLENKDFRDAALEYERTSYNYEKHEKSAEAGYAAVFSYREYLKKSDQSQRNVIKHEIIRSSLKFGEAYPKHKKAPAVLVAATDDLYAIRDFPMAIKIGRSVIEKYPNIETKYIRSSWLIVAHSSFDLTLFSEAEAAYNQVLTITAKDHKERNKLIENLAASIYKQGEQARKLQDHRTAANHFLRIATAAPTSKIRPTAEYDAAAALISLKDWSMASEVLQGFRKRYPKNKLQPEVTKKLAIVYKEDGKLLLAAAEFEQIEKETKDKGLRREALQQAAELYEKAGDRTKALDVYVRYVSYFPKPVENALEMRNNIANIYKLNKSKKLYIKQLQWIVAIDLRAGKERTDRTRFLAANASLVLAEPDIRRFKLVELKKPFKKNLNKKKKRMKKAIATLTKLVDYEVGIVTAAATYEIAEIYFHFSRALMNSERPTNLNEMQLEQYELVLEEQIYPFEEKAISVHEKNMELLDLGIYNEWIDKSIDKLAVLLPARYAKPEEAVQYVETILPVASEPDPASMPEKTPPNEAPVDKVEKQSSVPAVEIIKDQALNYYTHWMVA
ncbi:MAG: tetratricopeptide repeat protein [Gammaproteobacteria bacterium]|nr:tetratricopeptide repeat protein [Gammaproteobacteria bacterium]